MRCANAYYGCGDFKADGCEDFEVGRCNGNQIKLKYPCDRFKGVEADSCDGCSYKGREVYIACDHCCRNEMNKVDNYKFGGTNERMF